MRGSQPVDAMDLSLLAGEVHVEGTDLASALHAVEYHVSTLGTMQVFTIQAALRIQYWYIRTHILTVGTRQHMQTTYVLISN